MESTLNGESGSRFLESIQYSLCPVTQNRKDYEGERDKACKTAMHFLEAILHHKYNDIFFMFAFINLGLNIFCNIVIYMQDMLQIFSASACYVHLNNCFGVRVAVSA